MLHVGKVTAENIVASFMAKSFGMEKCLRLAWQYAIHALGLARRQPSGFRISGNQDIRLSGNPEIGISVNPDIRISGNPYIRICRISDIRKSKYSIRYADILIEKHRTVQIAMKV